MDADEEIISPFYEVPTEILFQIFSYLPGKQLIRCRQVSPRWKFIIDEMTEKEQLWVNFCQREFSGCYYAARQKAHRDISWYQLYRSLTLWPRLDEAVEETDEFASARIYNEEVQNIEILKNGLVGVHKKNKIQYFDVNSWTKSARRPITGQYTKYLENDCCIVVQSYQLHLHLIRKYADNAFQDHTNTFHGVKMCLLNENMLFFVNVNDEIYICDTYDNDNALIFRTEDQDGVISLGHSNGCLHILTWQRKIYAVTDNREMQHIITIRNNDNIMSILYEYNFLELLDWRIYFQWMYVLNHRIPEGPMQDIILVRSFGDLFFVGTNSGLLSIFYKPYIDGQLDLFRSEPLRRINFMERADIPILSTCPILQVDVLEVEDGHTVLVAMPKKVAVLKFTHNFLKAKPYGVMPDELQELQG